MGIRLGQANENMGFDNQYQQNMRDSRYRQGERMLGAQGQKYGYQQGQYSNQIAADQAQQNAIIGTGGSLASAYIGRPQQGQPPRQG